MKVMLLFSQMISCSRWRGGGRVDGACSSLGRVHFLLRPGWTTQQNTGRSLLPKSHREYTLFRNFQFFYHSDISRSQMSLEFKIIFCNESTRRSNFVAQLSRIQGGRCPRGVGNREILFYLTSLHSPSDLKTQTFQPSPLSLSLREGVKESGYSTVRLTVAFVKILGLKTH